MSRKGFTLVEVLVALSIVMVGVFGAYTLVNQSLALANTASMRLTAAYLAKEGIEIARNIRDSNYLNIYKNDSGNWDDGLTGCASGCGADYTMRALSSVYAGQLLKFDGNFFNYTSGKDTLYKRIITVVPKTDYLEVSVRVEWNERGTVDSTAVQENFYNWWQM